MKLTNEERSAILAGELRKLLRDEKPDTEEGAVVVLAWSSPRPYCDPETGHVFRPERERSAWLTVTKVVRTAKGGWAVQFDLTDRQQAALMLAPGSGYTTDRSKAIDPNEAELSEADRARLATEARARQAARRETDREQRRRQERTFQVLFTEALAVVPPHQRPAWLAEVERNLRATIRGQEAA